MVLPQPLLGLEAWVSHTGGQPRVCEQAVIKTLDAKAWASILVGSTLCVLSHIIIRSEHRPPFHWEEKTGSFTVGPCWTLPHVPLPFPGLICTFFLCNKCEYNGVPDFCEPF